MVYKTLLEEALKEVPDFKREYDNLIRDDVIDNQSGMHVVFGYAFTPLLIKAIKDNDVPAIRQLCAFLEKMAGCRDEKVQEVCDQSVLEAVAGEYSDGVIVPLFAKNTLKGLMSVREYIGEPEI